MLRTSFASIVCLSLLAVAGTGCKKSHVDKAHMLEALTKAKTDACACTDRTCAEKVDKRMYEITGDLSLDEFSSEEKAAMMETAGCVTKWGIK
jgi:hypothetical protein